MTQITAEHTEWAVVDRLRRLLQEPPHRDFNVTQTYALFTAILCWVVQRIRTSECENESDKIAATLLKELSNERVTDQPWCVYTEPAQRIEKLGNKKITVPAPTNFKHRSVKQFLINLRDATAHGDARIVKPFNPAPGNLLAGFTFKCAEFERQGRRRVETWSGEITLLECDIRRIGDLLAKRYCDAMSRSEAISRDSHFEDDTTSIREAAAA